MKVSVSKEISAPKEAVWQLITDIENSANVISSIIKIEPIDAPEDGLLGFKWKETRKVFGKESTEIMWVSDYSDGTYYVARAESHGCVYTSRLSVEETGDVTVLRMSFSGEPQTVLAKIMTVIMGKFIEKSMVKELEKDLTEIKQHVEHRSSKDLSL